MGLNLTPNEVVGYRILANTHSWDVVLVKRKGENSKDAGAEYCTTLAYCKNLSFAVAWIVNKVALEEAARLQSEAMATSGDAASMEALLAAFNTAREAALQAVSDLERRILSSGLELKDLKTIPSIMAAGAIVADGTDIEAASVDVDKIVAESAATEAP